MANPLFGEARAILGDGRELTLRFDFDALCALEDSTDKPIDEVLAEMAGPIDPATSRPSFRNPRLRTQQHLLYAATRFHHPELRLPDCQQLVTAHNSEILTPLLIALGRGMGKGDEIDEDEGGGADATANPRPSAPGIGADSSTAGAQPD